MRLDILDGTKNLGISLYIMGVSLVSLGWMKFIYHFELMIGEWM